MQDLNEFLAVFGISIVNGVNYIEIRIKDPCNQIMIYEVTDSFDHHGDKVCSNCLTCQESRIIQLYWEDRVTSCRGMTIDPYEPVICETCWWRIDDYWHEKDHKGYVNRRGYITLEHLRRVTFIPELELGNSSLEEVVEGDKDNGNGLSEL